MVNWQVTATTIYCDAVADEVTILVYKDWSAKCTGYDRYGNSTENPSPLLKQKGKQSKRKLECAGTECHRVVQYRDKLMAEAARTG